MAAKVMPKNLRRVIDQDDFIGPGTVGLESWWKDEFKAIVTSDAGQTQLDG